MPMTRTEKAGKLVEQTLAQRYDLVRQRIAAAAKRSGRPADAIMLVAVTKLATIDQVRELVEIGHTDLGENQVQHLVQRAAQIDEFLQRHKQLGRSGSGSARPSKLAKQVRWHMIGHLQRNKVRKALGIARLIHSVDSLRLAEEIQAAAGKLPEPVEVLVQVNAFGEKSKYGVAPAAASHLIDQIDTMLNLIYGLLALAVVIALIGIANTLALSIHERTRELGLLRAVGMTRRQVRTSVRWESVLIALLGTALGATLAVLGSWGIVQALADQDVTAFVVPATQMAVIVVLAGVAGVVAALGPARRAARLDVLSAISAD